MWSTADNTNMNTRWTMWWTVEQQLCHHLNRTLKVKSNWVIKKQKTKLTFFLLGKDLVEWVELQTMCLDEKREEVREKEDLCVYVCRGGKRAGHLNYSSIRPTRVFFLFLLRLIILSGQSVLITLRHIHSCSKHNSPSIIVKSGCLYYDGGTIHF